MTEVDRVDDPSRPKIDHEKRAAVEARAADAGVPINGDIGEVSIRRGGYLMTGDCVFGDHRDLSRGSRIDQA